MEPSLHIRPMQPDEETEVCELVKRVFHACVAPHYSKAGVEEFLNYMQPDLFAQRCQSDHFVCVAVARQKIVGAIEVRENRHVALLFVDKPYQRKGVGKELLRHAVEMGRKHSPELRELTVNASPNSVQAYETFGFRPTGAEQIKNGIRFTPMCLKLPKSDGP